MEEKTFKIVLADGTEIKNLKLNGNNYISTKDVDEALFEDNCSPLTVVDSDGNETVYENAELIRIQRYDTEYFIAFREKSAEEIQMESLQSKVEYIAMMTDVEV